MLAPTGRRISRETPAPARRWLPRWRSRVNRRGGEAPKTSAFRAIQERIELFGLDRDLRGAGFQALPANPANAYHGILNVRAGLALKAERILEVESDDGVARKLQQKEAERPDRDGVRRLAPFQGAHFRMTFANFLMRGGFELVAQ